jgi:hypothetical protein
MYPGYDVRDESGDFLPHFQLPPEVGGTQSAVLARPPTTFSFNLILKVGKTFLHMD